MYSKKGPTRTIIINNALGVQLHFALPLLGSFKYNSEFTTTDCRTIFPKIILINNLSLFR